MEAGEGEGLYQFVCANVAAVALMVCPEIAVLWGTWAAIGRTGHSKCGGGQRDTARYHQCQGNIGSLLMVCVVSSRQTV